MSQEPKRAGEGTVEIVFEAEKTETLCLCAYNQAKKEPKYGDPHNS